MAGDDKRSADPRRNDRTDLTHARLTIRRAIPTDAEAITQLAGQLGYTVTPEAVRERLRLAATGLQAVFVAEQEGAVVGWLQVVGSVAVQSTPYAEIVGLVTEAACRGQGIGAALLDQAEAWARRRGYASMRVRSNVSRDAAHRFYPRQGYRLAKTQHVYDKMLSESPIAHADPVP